MDDFIDPTVDRVETVAEVEEECSLLTPLALRGFKSRLAGEGDSNTVPQLSMAAATTKTVEGANQLENESLVGRDTVCGSGTVSGECVASNRRDVAKALAHRNSRQDLVHSD